MSPPMPQEANPRLSISQLSQYTYPTTLDSPKIASYNVLDSLPTSRLLILGAITLAKKDKKPAAKKASSATNVTRITASDTPVATNAKKTNTSEVKTKIVAAPSSPKKDAKEPKEPKASGKNPFRALGGYFAGAWYELKQVRWPNRKATWSLTLAVLAFTAFFALLILLLDFN